METNFCGFILMFWSLLSRNSVSGAENQKLLLILLDGFRWDYLDQPNLNLRGFQQIIERGVKADYLVPVYPSLSYPNYYSLATGLYVESHGMVSNYMYDVESKEKFLIGTNPEQSNPHWWNKAEPIWITAEKQNKRSYIYYWPGCEVTIRNMKPTHCQNYDGPNYPDDFARAAYEVLKRFSNGDADFGAVYFELFDKYGHEYGPKSYQVNEMLMNMDKEFQRILDNIDRMNLNDTLNVMIFADHGMADMTNRKMIDTTQVIKSSDYDVILEMGPLSSIWPRAGKENELYLKLKDFHPKMSVYLKDDVPERLHYKNDKHVAPITLIAEYPYYILTPEKPRYPVRNIDFKPRQGVHGYDNTLEDMRGIFLAFGPSFKMNYKSNGLEAVDLYQIMSRIIEIKPHANNGTWSNVKNMLTDRLPEKLFEYSASQVPVSSNMLSICSFIFFVFCAYN